MHEVSIAQNIIDAVHEYVAGDDLEQVSSVKIRIGDCSGVVRESLEFSFHLLIRDTPLRDVRLETILVPFQLECLTCGKIFTNEFGTTTCDICGSTATRILSGTELDIVEIEVNDAVPEAV